MSKGRGKGKGKGSFDQVELRVNPQFELDMPSIHLTLPQHVEGLQITLTKEGERNIRFGVLKASNIDDDATISNMEFHTKKAVVPIVKQRGFDALKEKVKLAGEADEETKAASEAVLQALDTIKNSEVAIAKAKALDEWKVVFPPRVKEPKATPSTNAPTVSADEKAKKDKLRAAKGHLKSLEVSLLDFRKKLMELDDESAGKMKESLRMCLEFAGLDNEQT